MHKGHVALPRRSRSSFQLARTVSGQTAFDKLVRPAALCVGDEAENRKSEEIWEMQNMNGVEDGDDGTSRRRRRQN